ncbi:MULTISPECIES: DUF6085 family protein [Streptomyces]|uniref:DUF6085 family protein n=1 Tax=Streptomyces TaxID=1883 RepID=UPI0005B768FC|nr:MULTISPECIES: DUF6085 family protein [Streptomyces]MDP9953181.1 hypothetical protein [Streptomyces sp. DSM 41269]
MPDVQGHCPACGAASLFLGEGGHVTCSRTDCPNPTAADDLLHGGEEALVQALGGGRTAHIIAHTLTVHGHSLADVRRMSDEEFRAVPGIGDTSLATIRRAFPAQAPGESQRQPPVVATARIHLDVAAPTTVNLPEFERAQAVARAEEAEATIRRVRDASAFIRATTRTWDPVADIIDAALDEDGDPVHARVALAVRTVLNQDLPGDMGGHVATAVLAVLRKEAPREP